VTKHLGELERQLRDAIDVHDLEAVRNLLGNGADPNAVAVQGDTSPLILACDQGAADAAKMLIDAGANINYQNELGETALICAVSSSNDVLVEYLLSVGADPEPPRRFSGEKSLLDYAKTLGNARIVELLLASRDA